MPPGAVTGNGPHEYWVPTLRASSEMESRGNRGIRSARSTRVQLDLASIRAPSASEIPVTPSMRHGAPARHSKKLSFVFDYGDDRETTMMTISMTTIMTSLHYDDYKEGND